MTTKRDLCIICVKKERSLAMAEEIYAAKAEVKENAESAELDIIAKNILELYRPAFLELAK